ncbi:MAG TPA: family 43 glycosylhydrolase, partial [Clostridiales bacterium]|nr:family 43 glycosylhydrolase [Clostridiales bacterium]
MKKFISSFTAFIITLLMFSSFSALNVKADNPIVQTLYTADPAPMVYNDTCYLYTSHDLDGSTYFTMPDWQCYSSTDMQNWTHHGTVLADKDFTWAEPDTAWAAQCVERNGKFYMYVPFSSATGGGRSIGVAVSDSPTGPFKDALGKPLLGPNWDYIDPTVFIDSDGQAYLYFGNPRLYYVKLNEDMTSFSGAIQKVDMNTTAFGTRASGDENHRTLYEEGPWFYKRGNLYYLVYSATGIPENICYSTSSSPTGPWTFRGEIMKSGGGSFTNHSGICDFKGKSYFFYHNGNLPGGGGFTRSVAVEEFKYNPDGSIPLISRTDKGPSQVETLNPFKRNEAETICWSSGLKTEVCSKGGMNVANVENGDYIKVSGADFKDGATSFTASVSSATNGGKIEIRLNGVDGKLIGTCNVAETGGWQTWENVECDVSEVVGENDLYFVFKGDSGFLFNVDWWQFTPKSVENLDDGYYFHSTFEGNTNNWTERGGSTVQTSGRTAYKG